MKLHEGGFITELLYLITEFAFIDPLHVRQLTLLLEFNFFDLSVSSRLKAKLSWTGWSSRVCGTRSGGGRWDSFSHTTPLWLWHLVLIVFWFTSPQDIFLVFDKNKTHHLEYEEVAPALKAAGRIQHLPPGPAGGARAPLLFSHRRRSNLLDVLMTLNQLYILTIIIIIIIPSVSLEAQHACLDSYCAWRE